MRVSSGTGIDDVDDGLEELDDDDGGNSRPQVEHPSQRSKERECGELRYLHVLPVVQMFNLVPYPEITSLKFALRLIILHSVIRK